MDAVNVSNYRRKITDFNISAYDQRLYLHLSQTLLSSSYKCVMPVIPELNSKSPYIFKVQQ